MTERDRDADLKLVDEFLALKKNKFQVVMNKKNEIIALIIGDDPVLDSIVAAIQIADKLTGVGTRHTNDTLN